MWQSSFAAASFTWAACAWATWGFGDRTNYTGYTVHDSKMTRGSALGLGQDQSTMAFQRKYGITWFCWPDLDHCKEILWSIMGPAIFTLKSAEHEMCDLFVWVLALRCHLLIRTCLRQWRGARNQYKKEKIQKTHTCDQGSIRLCYKDIRDRNFSRHNLSCNHSLDTMSFKPLRQARFDSFSIARCHKRYLIGTDRKQIRNLSEHDCCINQFAINKRYSLNELDIEPFGSHSTFLISACPDVSWGRHWLIQQQERSEHSKSNNISNISGKPDSNTDVRNYERLLAQNKQPHRLLHTHVHH